MPTPRIKSEFEQVLEQVRWNHPCEKCGAKAGEPCHTGGGNPTLTPHMYRFRRAHADAKAFLRNPRGAGRKALPVEDKMLKLTVTLPPDVVMYLLHVGGDNLSKGIRTVVNQSRKQDYKD